MADGINREILYKLRVDDAQGAAALESFARKMDKMRAEAAKRSEMGFLGLPSGSMGEKFAKGAASASVLDQVFGWFTRFTERVDEAHAAWSKGEISLGQFAGESLKAVPVLGKLAEGIEHIGNIANRATRNINENLIAMDQKFLKRLGDETDYAGLEALSRMKTAPPTEAIALKAQADVGAIEKDITSLREKLDKGEVHPERQFEAEALILAKRKEIDQIGVESAKKIAEIEAETFADRLAPLAERIFRDGADLVGQGLDAAVKMIQKQQVEELAGIVERNKRVDLLNDVGAAAVGLFKRPDIKPMIFHGTAPGEHDRFGVGLVAAAREKADIQTRTEEQLRVQREHKEATQKLAEAMAKLVNDQVRLVAANFDGAVSRRR